jgi:hypothetical protein
MRNIVRNPGPCMTLSRSLMNVRSKPVLFSNSACDIPSSSLRIARTTCPKAISAPRLNLLPALDHIREISCWSVGNRPRVNCLQFVAILVPGEAGGVYA